MPLWSQQTSNKHADMVSTASSTSPQTLQGSTVGPPLIPATLQVYHCKTPLASAEECWTN